MCDECPDEVNDPAGRLAAYIRRCDYQISGGLHIVIEDENVQARHIEWCQSTQELDEESAGFTRDLLAMPAPYRHQAVRMAWEDDREAAG